MDNQSLKAGNYIQAVQPISWDDHTIRDEVTTAMEVLKAVCLSVFPSYSKFDLEVDSKVDVEEMVQFFLDCRDYGFLGRPITMDVYDSPFMEKVVPFVLAIAPLTSLETQFLSDKGLTTLNTLSACINAVFARSKLHVDHDDPGSAPPYFEWGAFEHNIVGLNLNVTDEEGLTVYELSLLSGLTEQGVRNALQEPNAPKATKSKWQGLLTVPYKEAYLWLKTRAGFHEEDQVGEEGLISVPVDKRGYFFNASCRQRAGYKIGEKGDEKYYDSFHEALTVMHQMDVPKFRRPNENNRYGIVTGIRWVYKSAEELGIR